MTVTEYAVRIVKELERTMIDTDAVQGERLADAILASGKVFVAGAGRSGFAVKAFSMRLMHMGFDAYVVGETVTPNLEPGDLLIIGSGSGATGSLITIAEKAKKLGAVLGLITISPDSPIGAHADIVLRIPAPTPKASVDARFTSIQPMGSLFEQSLLLTLDAVILRLMEKRGQNTDTMFTKHANLE
ncbi:MAG: 6-phospho-3-hexuloisomerase [Clostridia bacterium]|nr:6-phospho-3-hexuloisomerase [Clostridia bacterium]